MKLVSYQHLDQPGWGLVTDAGLVPLHSASYPPLLSGLRAGQLDAIAAQARAPALPLAGIRFLPGIPAPGKSFCVGHNYEGHRIETPPHETRHPLLFLRVAESQTAHLQPIWRPAESTELDYEGEIAVVIAKAGRRIRAEDAGAHGAGHGAQKEGC